MNADTDNGSLYGDAYSDSVRELFAACLRGEGHGGAPDEGRVAAAADVAGQTADKRRESPMSGGTAAADVANRIGADIADHGWNVVQARVDAQGVVVELTAVIDGGRIRALRFRVHGCPHLIAAAEYVCARFESRPVAALDECHAMQIMDALQAPREKMGSLLVLEDAVLALAQNGGTAENSAE